MSHGVERTSDPRRARRAPDFGKIDAIAANYLLDRWTRGGDDLPHEEKGKP
jgi:hypothetical protein